MQEYFNLDIENNLVINKPTLLQKNSAILFSKYDNSNVTIVTPPLKCKHIKVWPGKDKKQIYSKCILQLEITENEWRFADFLTSISNKTKYEIIKHSKEWFGFLFSSSSMNNDYNNCYIENIENNNNEYINIQLNKKFIKTLTKKKLKSYRNKYIILELTYRGLLITNGLYTEIWRANHVFKTSPTYKVNSDEDELYILSDEDLNVMEEKTKENEKEKTKENKEEKNKRNKRT